MAAWLEDAWLGRYLDRLLSDDEMAWFEQYVLDKPRLLALIEADTQLRRALAAAGSTAAITAVQPTDAPDERDGAGDAGRSGFRPQRVALARRQGALRWVALAATLVAGVGIGRLAMRYEPPPVIANPTHVVFDTMRGAATAPRIERGTPGSEYLVIEVAVPAGAGNVALQLDGGSVPLAPGADGFVRFLLRKSQLASSRSARLDYTVDGQVQSRPLSLEDLNREK
jgi:hypothetical protein